MICVQNRSNNEQIKMSQARLNWISIRDTLREDSGRTKAGDRIGK